MPLDPMVYVRVFVNNPEGAQVLEEMERLFVRSVVLEGDNAALKTYFRQGQRDVIEWIASRINRANGAITMERTTHDE
jgi:hypothetical protein